MSDKIRWRLISSIRIMKITQSIKIVRIISNKKAPKKENLSLLDIVNSQLKKI